MKNISIPSPPSLGMSISDGTAHVYDRAEWKKIQTNVTYRVHIAFLRGPEIFIGIRCLARIERVKRYIIFRSLSLSLARSLSLSAALSLSLSLFPLPLIFRSFVRLGHEPRSKRQYVTSIEPDVSLSRRCCCCCCSSENFRPSVRVLWLVNQASVFY